jgi:phosphoribosyl 1,2-cyclic phosphodiesterase
MIINPLASSSKANCIYVSDETTQLLFDCGLPFKQVRQKLNFQTSSIQAVLVTHSHLDHCKAAKDVIAAGIDLYASQMTIDALHLTGHRVHVINPFDQVQIGTFTIMGFDTVHDAEGSMGFLFASNTGEKGIYLTDSAYSKYTYRNINYILIEANYDTEILKENADNGTIPEVVRERIRKSHFSLDTVKEFFLANDLSKVKEIHLLHLSDSNSDAERFKREIMEIAGKPVYVS